MLVSNAADWLENLTAAQKHSIAHLEAAFSERYIQPAILRFKNAKQIFDKRQSLDETVDTYANRLRSLG